MIRPSTVPGLYVLPGGSEPANISKLLHSTHLDSLIDIARAEYDFVLIDSPPMMGMADARLLSRNADGVILIRAQQGTTIILLHRALVLFACDYDVFCLTSATGTD